jgi:hypothetical protein
MKATVDIPDNLFRQAKIAAAEQGKTFREIVCEALSASLNISDEPVQTESKPHFKVDELGFVVYDPPFERKPVSDEFINRLREKLGV